MLVHLTFIIYNNFIGVDSYSIDLVIEEQCFDIYRNYV